MGIEQIILQGIGHFQLIVPCLIFRILSQSSLAPKRMVHLLSAFIGTIILAISFKHNAIHQILLTLITWMLHLSKIGHLGLLCTITCISYNLICELLIQNWRQISGTQMILSMKLISLAFDITENKKLKSPTFLQYFGYALCPGTTTMGLWVSYQDYLAIFTNPKWVRIK